MRPDIDELLDTTDEEFLSILSEMTVHEIIGYALSNFDFASRINWRELILSAYGPLTYSVISAIHPRESELVKLDRIDTLMSYLSRSREIDVDPSDEGISVDAVTSEIIRSIRAGRLPFDEQVHQILFDPSPIVDFIEIPDDEERFG